MDIERQLSEHLNRAAGRANATPDLAEVELGSRRVRGRRRVVTGVAAAMLIAGAGGVGFGLGRGAGGSDAQVAASADSETPAEGDATTTTIGDTGGQSDPANTTEQATAVPAPAPPLGSPGTMSGQSKVEGGGMPKYELVAERLTDSGITIRALRSESWYGQDMASPDANGWSPAPWCYGDAELRIGLAGPLLIDVTSATWYSELHSEVAVSATQAGWADGQPMAIVAVQVAEGVTEVAATSGTGADTVSDRVAPTGGLAVLLLPGIDPYADGYTVEITDASGARTLTDAELNQSNSPEWREACEPPPPPLPEAGEQPADAAAAEAAVRDVFAELFGSTTPYEEKPAGLLDDDTGVAAAIEVARNGAYADAVATAEYTIEDFVFTSPTEAWFRYDIDASTGHFGQRYGTAHLIDGSWRIARGVICQDLALAGAACEPDPGPIYPASWYDMYGGTAESCMEGEGGETLCSAIAESKPNTEATSDANTVPTTAAPDG